MQRQRKLLTAKNEWNSIAMGVEAGNIIKYIAETLVG
jgi:hypothetical protein